MASKAAQSESDRIEALEELLNDLETSIDRLKSMYEQYFLGIQKTAPAFLHTDVERKLRDLAQANIRQTRQRYKLVTLNQKFGSYNSYWRRTIREIESGRYIRNLQKIGRAAARSGDEIPEEILNAMPKRMREQVIRDRDAAVAQAKRRGKLPNGEFVSEDSTQEDAEIELGDLDLDGTQPPPDDDVAAVIREPSSLRRSLKPAPNSPHRLTKEDADFDLDAFFASVQNDEPEENTNIRQSAPQIPTVAPARITQPIASQMARPARITGSQAARPSQPELPPQQVTTPGVARIQAPKRPSEPMRAQPPQAQPPPPKMMPAQTMSGLTPSKIITTGTPSPPAVPGPARILSAQTMPGIQPTRPAAIQPAKPAVVTQPMPPVKPAMTPPPPRVTPPSAPGVPKAASQATKPLNIQPGATDSRPTPVVESISSGQFKRPPAAPGMKPPPGMSDADVNALHANYIKAKQMVGEAAEPGSRDKLLRTINAQAPKIMDQYKVAGVDFSVVVKDNQVIIRAKPKNKP